MKSREIRRRDFMKTAAGGTAAGALLAAGAFAERKRNGKIIGRPHFMIWRNSSKRGARAGVLSMDTMSPYGG